MKSVNGYEFAELVKNSIFEEKISQNNYFNSDLINEDDAIIIENETTDNCLDTTKKESNKSKLKIEEKDNVNKPFDVETNNIQYFNQAHNFFELESIKIESEIDLSKSNIEKNNLENLKIQTILKINNFKNENPKENSFHLVNNFSEKDEDKKYKPIFGKKETSTSKNENKNNKIEDINFANVLKRVLENNKREASVRDRVLFSCYPKSYLNLNQNTQKTQSNFFLGGHQTNRQSESANKTYLNALEFTLQAIPLWKKHEEIWVNASSLGFIISPDLEKYLLPPNEFDVLLSSYCKLNNLYVDKISINDSITNPNEEIKKWKNAYKKAVMRWHPDKLFPLIDRLKIKDESKKHILKKKSGHIMNNMYKMMQSILEILRKIIKKFKTS
jgi:hypothetical protein